MSVKNIQFEGENISGNYTFGKTCLLKNHKETK